MPEVVKDFTGQALERLARSSVLRFTIWATLWCVFVSTIYRFLLQHEVGGAELRTGLPAAAGLAIILTGPILAFLALRLRELAQANRKLDIVASTDSLTSCLNRGAFSTRVDARLADDGRNQRRIKGALLVIDADHFKSINDSFGHDVGDEALRAIAGAIRGQVRKGDLVGRLGGEEFGVFLPGATQENAAGVAERIRQSISEIAFRPAGRRYDLTVSVGGVSFEDQLGFVELFRIADRRLYQAKNGGRNRIELTHVQAYDASDMRPMH